MHTASLTTPSTHPARARRLGARAVLLVVAATFRRCSHECVRVPHAPHMQFLAVLYTSQHLPA